jgi:6-phosphogluconolactonase/glucosamine-6-phosphate isomerase/deaminase
MEAVSVMEPDYMDVVEDTSVLRVKMEDIICRKCGKKGHFAGLFPLTAQCYNVRKLDTLSQIAPMNTGL